MAEDLTRLFSTRAERYPEATEADIALGAGRAALAAIPVIGGTLTELLSLVLAPAVSRRRNEWFKELADTLDEAERKIEGFSVTNLAQDEVFVSAVIEATRFAISTHKSEKRDALRNGLLNIALHPSTDEDQQQTFMRYIDELTVWHLRILKFFEDPPRLLAAQGVQASFYMGGAAQALESMYPELGSRRELCRQIVTDLHARGLLNSPAGFLSTMMTASGMVAKRTTPLADLFLTFVSDPLA